MKVIILSQNAQTWMPCVPAMVIMGGMQELTSTNTV